MECLNLSHMNGDFLQKNAFSELASVSFHRWEGSPSFTSFIGHVPPFPFIFSVSNQTMQRCFFQLSICKSMIRFQIPERITNPSMLNSIYPRPLSIRIVDLKVDGWPQNLSPTWQRLH